MNNKENLVLASFIGDSLALGPHLIYNVEDIKKKFGIIDSLQAPATDYHAGKTRGDFTNYGDQAFILLVSLSEKNSFNLDDFRKKWYEFFKYSKVYKDNATKKTLANYDKGGIAGSNSDELGAVARIAPLLLLNLSEKELVDSAVLQTKMTNDNLKVLDAADFFARLTYRVLNGSKPSIAIMELCKNYKHLDFKTSLYSLTQITTEAIDRFGQDSNIDSAFPSVIHLIIKYEDNLKQALIESTMVGGDCATRNMLVAMVLGAYGQKVPNDWFLYMNKTREIKELIKKINSSL